MRIARPRPDSGQSTPLAAALVLVCGLVLVALVPLGHAVRDRTRARTAADAAVLAGAAEGEAAAHRLAAANGGEVVRYRTGGPGAPGEVVVDVRVGRSTARARAQLTPGSPPVPGPASGFPPGGLAGGSSAVPAGGGDRAGLAPAMLAALARADALLGTPVPVVSGRRTRAEQEALWANRAANPYPVARPGTSDHETGLAVDVARATVPAVVGVAGPAGLCQPLPVTDPVHFVVCGL